MQEFAIIIYKLLSSSQTPISLSEVKRLRIKEGSIFWEQLKVIPTPNLWNVI